MGTTVEEIPTAKRCKIEETVLNILRDADFETATESSVRAAAAEQLCDDFSDMVYKSFIRQVLESYLLSTVTPSVSVSSLDASRDHEEAVLEEDQKPTGPKSLSDASLESTQAKSRVICKLSDSRNVAVYDLRGQPLVSIQDYHQIGGKQFPSGQGISLTDKQWSNFKNSFSTIEEAIAKMESRLGPAAVEKLHKAISVSSLDDAAHQEPMVTNENQMDTSDLSSPPIGPQGHNVSKVKLEVLDSVETITFPSSEDQVASGTQPLLADNSMSLAPHSHVENNHTVNLASQSLVPIMTTRLYGKNYHCWVHQMDFFLKQLKLAHVLILPCPSIPDGPRSSEEISQAKVAAQKWIYDDYLCCHNILNSLSDNLFSEYSKKKYSAKELWEKLKFTYDEDFGTKRSLVNRYVQFEMVDGFSVVEQVQELNHIANSIMAAGIWVDENFHVSVVISKLPPSWMGFRRKLMHEEYLPLNMLIHRVKAEEESYSDFKQERGKDAFNSKVGNKVASQRKDGKRVCFSCGKEGHISKYCPVRSNKKYNEAAPTDTEDRNTTLRAV